MKAEVTFRVEINPPGSLEICEFINLLRSWWDRGTVQESLASALDPIDPHSSTVLVRVEGTS